MYLEDYWRSYPYNHIMSNTRVSRKLKSWDIVVTINVIFIAIFPMQFISMERKLLKWKTPGKRFEKLTGIHPADRNILFRGIWLRMARSGIASFAIVGSYYFSITHLVSSN